MSLSKALPAKPTLQSQEPRVLFKVTGSIAAYKACTVVSRLRQSGVRVKVAATPSALRMVGLATWEALSGEPVFTDVFQPGWALDHVTAAHAADLTLVCPATAHAINRFASGTGEDVVSTLFLAHDFSDATRPYWIAPAMNQAMWSHPITRASRERLLGVGVRFLDSPDGPQACGEVGPGRLAEPESIAAQVLEFLAGREGAYPAHRESRGSRAAPSAPRSTP